MTAQQNQPVVNPPRDRQMGTNSQKGLHVRKKNKELGIRIPSRRAEDVLTEAEDATALGSPGSCYLCPTRLLTDLVSLLKTTARASILSARALKPPSCQESWYPAPLSFRSAFQTLSLLFCIGTLPGQLSLIQCFILYQSKKIRMFNKEQMIALLSTFLGQWTI